MNFPMHYLPLAYLLVSLIFVESGNSENLNVKTSLGSGREGPVTMSVFIGNLTGKLPDNIHLDFDTDIFIDNLDRLKSGKGYFTDRKRNQTIEFSTSKQISEDEETKRFMLFCPENGESALSVISRAAWGAKSQLMRQSRTHPADLIIVNGHSFVTNYTDKAAMLREIEEHQVKSLGDLDFNFVISQDGKLFEGVGWDHYNFALNGGLGPESLIVVFMKEDVNVPPSPTAINIFKQFVKTAICTKRLSPHYSIIPYHLIFTPPSLSSENFERKDMRKWDWYKDNLNFLIPTTGSEVSAYVSRLEWSGNKPREDLMTLNSPIDYLVVKEYDARCFYNCSQALKIVERYLKKAFGDMRMNFIVAEDGRVYEGEGWNKTWSELFLQKNAVEVIFMGSFNYYDPYDSIFLAFNTLIEQGLRSGRLSTNYSVVTRKAMHKNSTPIGKNLEAKLRKLHRFKNTL